MQTLQVGEIKSDFSNILKQVQENGEKFVIEYGKKHKKVAMIVPYKEEKKPKRVFGILKGQQSIKNDFDDENDKINAMFYGEDI